MAALALAGVAAMIVTGKGKRPIGQSPAAKTSSAPSVVTQPPPAVVPQPVAEALLARYASAYSAKSPSRLSALLAPTMVRRNGNHPAEDRREAIATYRNQFRQLQHPVYRLADVKVTTASGGALVSARYRITSQAGTVESPITFHIVKAGDRLEIDRITIPLKP